MPVRKVFRIKTAWLFLIYSLLSGMCPAFKVNTTSSDFDHFIFSDSRLRIVETIEDVKSAPLPIPNRQAIDILLERLGPQWRVLLDLRTGRPTLVEGGALPWIPGPANALDGKSLGLSCDHLSCVPAASVERLARQFLAEHSGVFAPEGLDLVVDKEGSLAIGESIYLLRFQPFFKGIPLEEASIYFRINNGNLIQIAARHIGTVTQSATPAFSAQDVWRALEDFLHQSILERDQILDKGSLVFLPITPDGMNPEYFKGPIGGMLSYALAYRLVFQRAGVQGTWEARVDAQTGRILLFADINRYGHIQGGVYKTDKNPTQTEANMPFPWADYGAGAYADVGGNFSGTNGTCTMTGRTGSAGQVGGVRMSDACGAVSRSANASGTIDFGSAAGTDCSTPGFGGAGNTHAARTQYWNVSQIKIKAYTYLSGNTWLQGQVTDNVNLNQTCNAYWNGSTLNFFRSGGGCANTGELPGVSLHEWGHGMDSNDGSGGTSPPVETRADWTALLQTHQSCAGGGFFQSGNCSGYGDACLNCTGIREADWNQHSHHTAWTPQNNGQASPGYNCSSGSYNGPCGWEDHCESGIATQALWDFVNRDLIGAPTNMDLTSAWQLEDRLFYAGMPSLANMYTCSGSPATSNGCGGTSLYSTMRALDDDDGNLANGTPHAAAIFAALNRHGIACGASGDATNQNHSGCPALTLPTLSGSAGNNQAILNWTTGGAGATRYFVFRNETDCAAGFTRIATVNAPTLTTTDTTCVNGLTYYYRIQAATGNDSCTSAMSNCVTLTPQPCTTPSTPSGLSATASAANQVTLLWTAGSGNVSWNIYRSNGICPGGVFTKIGSSTGTTFQDTGVSGGTTYSYKVTGLDATGACESGFSNCAQATATGFCRLPPTFSGVQGAVPGGAGGACKVDLSWSSGSAGCGGATLKYDVYRSTDPAFSPASGNMLASCVGALAYSDASASAGTTYYYIVRAEDSTTAGNGPCNSGNQDANTVRKRAVPGVFSDDAGDSKAAQFTMPAGTNGQWVVRTVPDREGLSTKAYATEASGTYPNSACTSLVSPSLALPATAPMLTFWSLYDIENGYDAGIVEISTNGGTTWSTVPVNYPSNLPNSGNACGLPVNSSPTTYFSGTTSSWAQFSASLSTWAGSTALIRFRFSTDSSVGGNGWYVDDIALGPCTSCTTPEPPTNLTNIPGFNQVQLNWQPSITPSVQYEIYRSDGACPGGTFASVGVTAQIPYLDYWIAPGTYAYHVTAKMGSCESTPTNCSTSTPSGCTPPSTPSALSATPNGSKRIDLAWTGSAASYRIYRTTGACPGTGAFVQIGTSVSASYSDTNVAGGIPYAYKVSGVDTTGWCESALSACASATAAGGGACTAYPTFTGAVSVASGSESVCSLHLTWNSAVANCGGSAAYNVYRSTSAGFTPSASTLIAACLPGTSFLDESVSGGTTYYYIVRSEDDSGNGLGLCRSGNEDPNLVRLSGAIAAAGGDVLWDNMEGAAKFTGSALVGASNWALASDTDAHSASHLWKTSGPATVNDQVLTLTTAVGIPPNSRLTFWHNYDLEHGSNQTAYDGAVLEISANAGASWTDLGGAILEGGYDSLVSSSYGNPLGGRAAWSGRHDGIYLSQKKVTVDLGAWAGATARIRFRLGSDTSGTSAFWKIDDVLVTAPLSEDVEGVSANAESQARNGSIADDGWMVAADAQNVLGDEHDWYSVSQEVNDGSTGCGGGGCGIDDYLITSPFRVPSASPVLSFWHHYDLENKYDGAEIYITTDGGSTWTDLNSSITSGNGYTSTIYGSASSWIAGASAWTGDSAGWHFVTVSLATWAGTNAMILFRNASDLTGVADGWYVDDIQVSGGSGTVKTYYDDIEQEAPGWTTTTSTGLVDEDWWTLATWDLASSPIHVWYGWDAATSIDNGLMTSPFAVPVGAQLAFQHWFALEASAVGGSTTGYDGGVLEISVDNGASWDDLGPAITSGGYTRTISTAFGNPLAGRAAWSGSLNGTGALQTVSVNLGAYAGTVARIRFRLGTDSDNTGFTGSVVCQAWVLDNIKITGSSSCALGTTPGEVSSQASGTPLLLKKSGGAIQFRWQAMGPSVQDYNIYEGFIGSYWSERLLACHVPGVLENSGGRRVAVLTPSGSSSYFFISASNAAGEGPMQPGHSIPAAGVACGGGD